MIPPRVEIDLTEDKNEGTGSEPETAEEQHSIKIKQENIEQEQTPNLGINVLTHEDNLAQNGSNLKPDQPIRNDANGSILQDDGEAPRASEGSNWPREDSESDEDDGDCQTEPDDEDLGDEDSAFSDHEDQSLSSSKDTAGLSRQPPATTRGQTEIDEERAHEDRAFNDREREMLETLNDIPNLPEQPNLDRDALEQAPKRQKKKFVAAAKPILATVSAATSRRMGPVLPPVSPTIREIFKDLVVKQKLKGKALYKKASDVVDERGKLSRL